MEEDIKIRSRMETELLRRNEQLEQKIEDDKMLIEYLSMMADVELPEQEGEEDAQPEI